MPFVAYVHAYDQDGPEDGGRSPWEPNWRVWRWVAVGLVLGFAATRSAGVLETVLVFLVFALACRAAVEALPYGDGLREWRQ